MMTFIPGNGSSQLMTLDIEYTTWGNPASEVVYFPSGSCCGQRAEDRPEAPSQPASDSKTCEHPGIAFLIASASEMTHPDTWQDYLAQTEEAAVLHFGHSDTSSGLDLIRAQLSLLKKSLSDESLTHFIFLPNDALPARNLLQLLQSLRLDARSRMSVRSWEDQRKTNVLRAQLLENLGEIRKELAHFHSPWVCLSREDALLLNSQDLTTNFENCPVPTESYFATALAVLGRPPLQNVAPRSLTWDHPDVSETTSELIAHLTDSGAFFATDLPPDTLMLREALHGAWSSDHVPQPSPSTSENPSSISPNSTTHS